jgi:RNA 3'-terminal phosphate cyclase (ATP)
LEIKGIALSSLLTERRVSDRMAEECQKSLQAAGYSARIDLLYDTEGNPVYEKAAAQAGAALAVWARTDKGCLLGADCAGAPRRSSEFIGRKVAGLLTEALQSGASLDVHMGTKNPFCGLAERLEHLRHSENNRPRRFPALAGGTLLGQKQDLKPHSADT